MRKSLHIDFWVLIGIIAVSVPIIFYFNLKPLTSALFFYVVPTIYLFIRKKKPIKRVLVGSLLIGVGVGFIFNVILSANNAWNELPSQLVFNYRIFGFWPVDEPIWFWLWSLLIIVFYEHFYEREDKGKISKKFKFVAFPVFIALVYVFIAIATKMHSFQIPYAYLSVALVLLVPVIFALKYYPKLILKFLKTSIFFFFLFLVYELIAVKMGQWYFPGQYVGWVELLGQKFPFEELIFWMLLGTFGTLAVYEWFVDDEK